MTSPGQHWTYLQALAWIRWRDLEVVAEFAEGDVAMKWSAAVMYPSMPIVAGDSPGVAPTVVCSNPRAQLDSVVADGRLRPFAVNGLAREPIEPAVWHGLRVTKNSVGLRGGVVLAELIIFHATELKKLFRAPSVTKEKLAGLEADAFAWLLARMAAGPKRRGQSSVTLRDECQFKLGAPAWKRAYKAATDATTSDPSWGKTGPGVG